MLLTLGTGIGGGIISHGRVLHGCVGMAGELGHMTVFPTAIRAGAVTSGASEARVGYGGGRDGAHAWPRRDHNVGWSVRSRGGRQRSREDDLSRDGRSARDCARQPDQHLQLPAVPDQRRSDRLMGSLCTCNDGAIALRSFTYRNSGTRIEKAILGSEAGLYGAAYLPFLTQTLD